MSASVFTFFVGMSKIFFYIKIASSPISIERNHTVWMLNKSGVVFLTMEIWKKKYDKLCRREDDDFF